MGLRTELRRFIKSLSSRNSYVIAGLGRCGTTLVYKSIIDTTGGVKGKKFITRFSEQKRYINGSVYKTHDLPPARLPENVKLVYMFGNPMNAALSGYHTFVKDKHFHNIGSDMHNQRDNLFTKDILLLEKHFDAWYKPQGFKFISIRYEALYERDTLDMLEKYLEFKIRLPTYRERKTNWETHLMKQSLEKTYSRLDAKIRAAEDCKIWLQA
jgi:hypothetical protein